MHVYLYTYVIHCSNGCTNMFYYCVIFVILNLKKERINLEDLSFYWPAGSYITRYCGNHVLTLTRIETKEGMYFSGKSSKI